MPQVFDIYRAISQICVVAWALMCFPYLSVIASIPAMQERNPNTCKSSPACQEALALAAPSTATQTIAPGESHWYKMQLQVGQYVQILVFQKGIDVITTICDPDLEHIVDIDDTTGNDGIDTVSLVAEKTGCYRFRIEASGDQRPASYELRVSATRTASVKDRERVKAEWALFAGNVLGEGNDLEAYRQSIKNYSKALASFEGVDDPRAALALKGLGYVYGRIYEFDIALQYLIRAERRLRGSEWQVEYAQVLNNLGYVYTAMGQGTWAEENLMQAISHWQALKNAEQEAIARTNLGDLFYAIGEYEKAREQFGYVEKHLDPQKDNLVRSLLRMGMVNDAQGHLEEALDYYNRALSIVPDRDLGTKAGILNSMTVSLGKLKRTDEALALIEKLRPIYDQRLFDKRAQAIRYNTIGGVYNARGEYDTAVANYKTALSFATEIKDSEVLMKILYNLASAQRSGGRLNEAKSNAESAIELYERFRVRIDSPTLRQSYSSAYSRIYQLYVELLVALNEREAGKGFDVAALEASERARSRVLLDFLIEAKITIDRRISRQLAERLRDVQENLNNAMLKRARSVNSTNSLADQSVEAEYRKSVEAYDRILAEVRKASPEFYNLIDPVPITVAQMRRDILDDQTALVEFSVGPDRSFVFAVTRGALIIRRLPSRDTLKEQVDGLRRLLTERNCIGHNEDEDERSKRIRDADLAYEKAAYALSRQLLGPVAALIENKRLAIVADGPLHLLPFGALPDPSGPEPSEGRVRTESGKARSFLPLFVAHEIVSLPSATVLLKLRETKRLRTAAAKSLAVIADPVLNADDQRVRDLAWAKNKATSNNQYAASMRSAQVSRGVGCEPTESEFERLGGFREEGDAISRLVRPGQAMKAYGLKASIDTLRKIGNFRLIHFATHGFIPSNAEQGSLVLSAFNVRDRKSVV